MEYFKYMPWGEKLPHDALTTSQIEIQLWQELTMLRHISGPNKIYARETIAPWIDQAKIYFLDAFRSNWKSAGLLYYYCFLNLAKAYLVTNRAISGRDLKSTSIYHGLTADPQKPKNIINFKIEIHPPGNASKRNIFSQFYQKLIKEQWPFKTKITIDLSDIISYCDDISHELYIFYNIRKASVDVLSLIRNDGSICWLELLIFDDQIEKVKKNIGKCIEQITRCEDATKQDKLVWIEAFGLMPIDLKNRSLLRISQLKYTEIDKPIVFSNLINNTKKYFKGYILPLPKQDFIIGQYWDFIPELAFQGSKIKWHPLLSNYLFAFMLSTVLRYQPHIFVEDSKDSFIAEAWCNQSATTSIRYFLMEFSKQHIRLN